MVARGEQTLKRAVTGDREALRRLPIEHQHACYAMAVRLTCNATHAEEVCPEAFEIARELFRIAPVGRRWRHPRHPRHCRSTDKPTNGTPWHGN